MYCLLLPPWLVPAWLDISPNLADNTPGYSILQITADFAAFI